MIGFLKGIIEARNDPYLLIDVGGVGYKVLTSYTVLSNGALIGDRIKLFTHTHVREDVLELYGFGALDDLQMFELLIGVSGIGPKTAIGIFALGKTADIKKAVVTGDISFFTSVPRLGKKNAQKIIIELKSKLGSTTDLDLSSFATQEYLEVVSALKAFGFSSKEASEAMKEIKGQGKTTEDKVRLALKYLGK